MANRDKLVATTFNAMKYAIECDVGNCKTKYKYSLTIIRNGDREKVDRLTPEMISEINEDDMIEGKYLTVNAGVDVIFRTDYYIKSEGILHSVDGFTEKALPEHKKFEEKAMYKYLDVFLDKEQDDHLDRESEEYKEIEKDILLLYAADCL